MELLQTVLVTLVTLGILVTIHEYGHFAIARLCGVKVLRFCVGFGKPLVSWHDRHGTEYAVAAIPLGGYVKMLDEREAPVPADQLQYAFNRKSVGARMAIVSAGPIANLLLAIAAFWLIYVTGVTGVLPVVGKVEPDSIAAVAGLKPGQEIVAVDGNETPTIQALNQALLERIGETGTLHFSVREKGSDIVEQVDAQLHSWLSQAEEPDLIGSLGLELWHPPVPAVIGEVLPGTPAERGGIKVGDRVVSVDGQAVALWEDWVAYVRARPGVTMNVELVRNDKTLTLPLTPDRKVDDKGAAIGQVGVGAKPPVWPPEMLREQHFNVVSAIVPAVKQTWETTAFTLVSIKKMLTGLISHKNLSGPVTIAKVAAASAKTGWESYVSFLALLSISLGVLNLLPVPVLDGGHLLFYAIEAVRGSPVPDRIQNFGTQIGLGLVMMMMMLALYNDFSRLLL
jgi:regulator of sigma E protease